MNDCVGGKIEGGKVVCSGGNSGTDCDGASDCCGNDCIGCGNDCIGGNTCAYALGAPRPPLNIDNETKTNGKGRAIFLII
jgi:hypothetical protein